MLFAVATPMQRIAPINAGTLSRVLVKKSKSTMPAKAAGSAVIITNGSSHDWKLTTMSMYMSTMDNSRPASNSA